MNKLLILSILLIAGCSDPVMGVKTDLPSQGWYSAVRVLVITNSGHRFLIVQSSSHDAISVIEITPNSLIEQK